MTTEELYRQIGGDYADTLRRLGSSERIQRFLSLFLREDSCRALADALREGRAEDAFRVAHSLKGMCLNQGDVPEPGAAGAGRGGGHHDRGAARRPDTAGGRCALRRGETGL